jgi:hypothetical protein
MDKARLTTPLATLLDPSLASALAADFVKIRQDYATRTLERASPGKFVETFVQCLQWMATGSYDAKPDVDGYLKNKVESETSLPEGLRICAARVARSIYTLRNKRNIAHKNEVDPNVVDLAFIHQGAAWIMAELIRSASGITMEEAGAVIELVQAPVGALVEEIDGTRLVHADISIPSEVLILLHSHFPQRAPLDDILTSLSRRSPGSVKKQLRSLRSAKLIHGDNTIGYRLTQPGHAAAVRDLQTLR